MERHQKACRTAAEVFRRQRLRLVRGCYKNLLLVLLLVGAACVLYFFSIFIFEKIDKYMHPIKYTEYVEYYSELYNVPIEIPYGVVLTESGFRPNAVSTAGASGLMQLMPKTYENLTAELNILAERKDIFNPQININCGIFLLSKLYVKYKCWETVYAAYNAGEAAVDKWLSDDRYSSNGRLTYIPYTETFNYVKKVKSAVESYKKIYGF